MACLATSLVVLLSAVQSSAVSLSGRMQLHRPSPSSYKRTMCSSPASSGPVPTPYQLHVDYPGSDLDPCGSLGCSLPASATHLDCETKCNATAACVAYVFADGNCSGSKTGQPICWLKSSVGQPATGARCRNSRVIGAPNATRPDLITQWGTQVSATQTPLDVYPRPQMLRGNSDDRDTGDSDKWVNLNGLWEWQPTDKHSEPPIGQTLNGSILVPFPVESCLSGVAPQSAADIVMSMWYRLSFELQAVQANERALLHFGAVDWQSAVYVNGHLVGNHTGGYDGFSFDVTSVLLAGSNELLVYVYDPSDSGAQPNGKQRISAIDSPGGDTYTPTSGIWQTVWLESVPRTFIKELSIDAASTSQVQVSAELAGDATTGTLTYEVLAADGKTVLVNASGPAGAPQTLAIPSPQLWSPTSPHLYDIRITTDTGDAVLSYFGLRTFTLGKDTKNVTRPLLNGNFTFLAGFLDQSFWPDGQYTAPTDDGLAYDVKAVPMFGLNMIRLHQKVNPERWYYHADTIGVVVFQDMIQKYGGATKDTVPLFVADLKAMIQGRKNHPCIVQFTTFNEGDCWEVFTDKAAGTDVPGIVAMAKSLAPTHLVDTDSGGGANNLHIGDVNDIHSYPQPGNPVPSDTQYAMVGEFGGIGAFITGKEWKPHSCHTYLPADTPEEEAADYIGMVSSLITDASDHVSASVYTQTTDVELECDGFLNYDRTNKFSDADTAAIRAVNQALTQAGHE